MVVVLFVVVVMKCFGVLLVVVGYFVVFLVMVVV